MCGTPYIPAAAAGYKVHCMVFSGTPLSPSLTHTHTYMYTVHYTDTVCAQSQAIQVQFCPKLKEEEVAAEAARLAQEAEAERCRLHEERARQQAEAQRQLATQVRGMERVWLARPSCMLAQQTYQHSAAAPTCCAWWTRGQVDQRVI